MNLKYINVIMLKNKKILIVGGTGSFGQELINKIIKLKIKFSEIRVFSRDEKKQDDMRKNYKNSNIKFYIGDVRDKDSIYDATKNIDYIFHAAALKQVPSCEFHPLEAVKTNILGTENVLESAILNKVKKVVCLSTDKAVYPINAMGISKSLMEKLIIAKSRFNYKKIDFCITRYGNVMGSRGSVIPMIINQIKKNEPITITDFQMTRFMMSMNEALDLVLYALKNGKNGEIFIKKSPACDLKKLTNALLRIYKKPNYKVVNIGIRHGEKIHETLMSREEKINSIENKNFFIIKPDKRDLNYNKYYIQGNQKGLLVDDYTSKNTNQLSVDSLIRKIEDNLKY